MQSAVVLLALAATATAGVVQRGQNTWSSWGYQTCPTTTEYSTAYSTVYSTVYSTQVVPTSIYVTVPTTVPTTLTMATANVARMALLCVAVPASAKICGP